MTNRRLTNCGAGPDAPQPEGRRLRELCRHQRKLLEILLLANLTCPSPAAVSALLPQELRELSDQVSELVAEVASSARAAKRVHLWQSLGGDTRSLESGSPCREGPT